MWQPSRQTATVLAAFASISTATNRSWPAVSTIGVASCSVTTRARSSTASAATTKRCTFAGVAGGVAPPGPAYTDTACAMLVPHFASMPVSRYEIDVTVNGYDGGVMRATAG